MELEPLSVLSVAMFLISAVELGLPTGAASLLSLTLTTKDKIYVKMGPLQCLW